MSLLVRLWDDESGFTSSADVVLLFTIIGLAVIVGLQTVRDALIQEFGDMAEALESIDQSYSFTVNGTTSQFTDSEAATDACITVCIAATEE